MFKKTFSLITVAAAIILLGAACTKKATVNVNNTSVSVNVPLNTAIVPSGTTTGDFTTSTNTNTSASAATVTITAAGVSPKTVTITAGTTVTFINTDTIAHHVASNPHPSHTDYPGFDNTAASQTYSFTFTKTGSFGYHDHLDPTNTAMQGTIIVQ